jgi:DNA-binding transcriptional ArsR family regulator
MTFDTDQTDGDDAETEPSPPVQLDGGELSLDAIFHLLSNRRRRLALYFLSDVRGPVGREELARRIVTWEVDADIEEASGEQVTRTTVSLDHAHLPRLEDDGVVTYDREADVVEPTDALSKLEPYLELARPTDLD